MTKKKEYVRFSFILFVYSFMVGYSEKKNGENCLRKCFKTKEKEITPQVRENRSSNNCAHFLPRMVCLWLHFSTETGPNKNAIVTRTTRMFFVSATIVIFVASL